MKKIYLLMALLCGVCVFSACSNDDHDDHDNDVQDNMNQLEGVWALTSEISYQITISTGDTSHFRESKHDPIKASYGSQIFEISKGTDSTSPVKDGSHIIVWYEYQINWQKQDHKFVIKDKKITSTSSFWNGCRITSVSPNTLSIRDFDKDGDIKYVDVYTFSRIEKVPDLETE